MKIPAAALIRLILSKDTGDVLFSEGEGRFIDPVDGCCDCDCCGALPLDDPRWGDDVDASGLEMLAHTGNESREERFIARSKTRNDVHLFGRKR